MCFLEQQKCFTTQIFFSVWEKAAATDFPLPTSRIFKISSDRFGLNAKICPWKIITITSQKFLYNVQISLEYKYNVPDSLFSNPWIKYHEKRCQIQILTWFEVTTSVSLSGERFTVVTDCPICHVSMTSIWLPLICRQCTALPWKTYLNFSV